MNVIITMSGEGARFKKDGVLVPKPMVQVKGRALLEWALISLTHFFDCPFLFITRRSHNTVGFVKEKCAALGIGQVNIKEIDFLTKGQAATVMEAEVLLADLDDEILIYNIDTYVDPAELKPEHIRGYGWVPAFEAEGDHWSFVKCGDGGRVTQITEKERISRYGSIGLYYFRSFRLFKDAYEKHYRNGSSKEEYIAPIYNVLLKENKDVHTTILNKSRVHVLGTPEEVEIFNKGYKP
ncbi:MAG: glycosyltransferase family 2 protein [Candidatus Omnitrophica bacterium]|nr:glycosyltransferase family 2 protein [Candidatus Omnitrophota bacterium]